MLLIPVLIAALIGVHIYLVTKLGTTAPPWLQGEAARDRSRAGLARHERTQKEEYLREYQVLKCQGKPFFPYAVLKDSAMACIVLAVIILMAVILGAGELSNRADPTTVTYTPRPDWYFYFLFELLRVIKPPSLVFIATIGMPTIALVLLALLPFYDRIPSAGRSAGRSRPPPQSR